MFLQSSAQTYLKQNTINAWVIYDFRGSNPVLTQFLGYTPNSTRRSFTIIPQQGEPFCIVHELDCSCFERAPYQKYFYKTWHELTSILKQHLTSYKTIAAEYSPGGELPIASWVDGGTMELLQSLDLTIQSSADLFQIACASWTPDAVASHETASKQVAAIKDQAFDFIRSSIVQDKPITEYDVAQYILEQFKTASLETEDSPVVAVNQNAGNPHYEPRKDTALPITNGDWVLIDLWARTGGDETVFSDITWVGYVESVVSSKHQEIFDIVQQARDACILKLQNAWEQQQVLHGWELDDVARNVITEAGYGENFIHRTGHSLGPGSHVHGLGVNIDNYETHDTRQILPGTGFTIEPGIYLPEFGVRLEINVFIHPEKGPLVTSPVQQEIVLLV